MGLLRTKFTVFLLLVYSLTASAQVQALFNNKTQLRNMTERWELDTTAVRGTFLVTPYKPIYILPGRWTSHPNEQPHSGNIDPTYIAPPGMDYDNIETKFQLSFKTKILQSFLWGHADLWVAYTQISHWQIYNTKLSRPFREVNYEPEVILNFPIKFKLLGFKARMAGVAFNHESNGKSEPFSRSWNRVIFHAGFERKNWSVYIRPWIRMSAEKDDNPDISKYVGHGDVNVIYTKNGNILSFIGSHNLIFNTKSKGNASFSWSYPIKNNLKGYLLISHGFGETLIDYNNRQTTVGVGVSLIEWL
ncbi:phospholipase A [Flavobacterium sp. GT3R68]|uniref:phospholipase A n=1 Tax=Flavobacterium sp. GT3R68 TaxID=2594437 RepID=UPI000F870813|nr:phospholipase A [Flavobacterium sp. GT3R68]RTY94898.1 phospholipase [Flavobacterium sp. GSN2]TRW91702.1 phospholipase A [Flavobacterium sp. GT3R68]